MAAPATGGHTGAQAQRKPVRLLDQNDTSPDRAGPGRESNPTSTTATVNGATGSGHRTPGPSVPTRILVARLRYRGKAGQRAARVRLEER